MRDETQCCTSKLISDSKREASSNDLTPEKSCKVREIRGDLDGVRRVQRNGREHAQTNGSRGNSGIVEHEQLAASVTRDREETRSKLLHLVSAVQLEYLLGRPQLTPPKGGVADATLRSVRAPEKL